MTSLLERSLLAAGPVGHTRMDSSAIAEDTARSGMVAAKSVVGVGEMGVSNDPRMVLATYLLGSCLGVSLYDPVARAGGLVHVMLPNSSLDPEDAAKRPAKFIDTGVPGLFRALYELKAEKSRMQICVAGGAQLMDQESIFDLGQRNCRRLEEIMRQHGLKIQAEHVGGMVNRTMLLDLGTGQVRLKLAGQAGEIVLFKG